jgi:hypothetical protein
MRGICTSMKISSGSLSVAIRTASTPSAALTAGKPMREALYKIGEDPFNGRAGPPE